MNQGPPVFQGNQPLFPSKQESTPSTQTSQMGQNYQQTSPPNYPPNNTPTASSNTQTNYYGNSNYSSPSAPTFFTPSSSNYNFPPATTAATMTSSYVQTNTTSAQGTQPVTAPFPTTGYQGGTFTPTASFGTGSTPSSVQQPPIGPPPTYSPTQSTTQQGPPPGFSYTPLSSISTGGTQSSFTPASSVNPVSKYPQPVSQPVANQPKTSPRDSKINPSQIPSPTTINPNATSKYFTRANAVPPSALTNYVAVDEGNSTPRVMRMTTYTLPSNSDSQKSSHLPVGFILQPFADSEPGEEPIPLVDFGPNGPLRCIRCKAYINPFVTFTNGGRDYKCKICDVLNEVPREYFAPLDINGRRVDLANRPELSKGTVDFVATQEYITRPLTSPAYLFAIDVSFNSVTSGLLQLFVDSIKRILQSWPLDSNVKVGFVTYDTTVHFYNLSPTLQNPQMMVVADIDSMFVPLSEEVLFVRYSEAQAVVDSLLSKLPSMFANTKTTDSCFGALLQAGVQSLGLTGGKLIAFQTILPSVGPGKLPKREDSKSLGTDKEKTMYQPHDPFYTGLVKEFIDKSVSVDLFLMPTAGFIDVATLSTIPKQTGGQVYYYHGFNYTRDAEKFYHELYRNLTRTSVFDGIMRVRTGKGLSVTQHYGNFYTANELELQFPSIDSDKSILVELKHDDKLDEKSETLIQVALLYTTASAQRRVRIFNMALPASSILGNLFRNADLDAVVNYLARTVLNDAPKKDMAALRASLVEQCVNILYSYRKYCATTSSAGQLILPEALKLLPVYTLALLKNALMRPGSDIVIDERSYLLSLLNSLPATLSSVLIYPRMFVAHELPADIGTYLDEEGHIKFPQTVRLTSEMLSSDGAYLLEDGQKIFLWIGKTNSINLQQLDEKLSILINAIRKQRTSFPVLHVIRQGDPTELKFFTYLVEDKALDTMNYVDFLCHVHRQIQGKLA